MTPVETAAITFRRGVALLHADRPVEAAAALGAAVAAMPGHAEARSHLGVALACLKRHEDALNCFKAAAVLQPFSAAAQGNLGHAFGELGRHAEAEACYRRATAMAPNDPMHRLRLAHALLRQGLLVQAIDAYRDALDLPDAEPRLPNADRATAWNNLGNALRTLDRPAEAVPCYEAALALQPDAATIQGNLGKALLEQRALPRAERCFRTALALGSDLPDARTGLAVALLTQGRLRQGFALFEHRWQMPQMRGSARGFAQPQWRGEPADGRTLLVHAEQGQGDTLQFCRYAVLAARRGFRVVLEVQPSLVRLMRRLPDVADVVARGDTLPLFDLHCPMLSLPLAFDTELDTIPADSFLRTANRPRRSGPLEIGLCWAGNAYAGQPELAAVDRRRSIPPSLLSPLLAIPNARFHSLQKGDASPWSDPRLQDRMAAVRDFADTAAQVATLDLVIAVDSAVAHLAAALGCPVWLLDRFDACWRWLDGRCDSPWYPELRLYRQQQPGDWPNVVARVGRDLGILAGASRSGSVQSGSAAGRIAGQAQED